VDLRRNGIYAHWSGGRFIEIGKQAKGNSLKKNTGGLPSRGGGGTQKKFFPTVTLEQKKRRYELKVGEGEHITNRILSELVLRLGEKKNGKH